MWGSIILGFVLAIVIVNKAQQLYMRLIGAEFMFFNGKKKLCAIVFLGLFISAGFWRLLGIA